jgi:uncharacterized protein DUF3551
MAKSRYVIFAGTIGVTLLAPSASFAQDYPYCLQGRDYGYPGNCQFMSYQQCEATASGTFSYCGINPRFAYRRQWGASPSYSHQW